MGPQMGGGSACQAVQAVREGVSYLAELMTRIVSRIRKMARVAPLAMALGCEMDPASTASKPGSSAVAPVEKAPIAANDGEPQMLGTFDLTFYYVVGEEDVMARLAKKQREAANDNGSATELATIVPAPAVEMQMLYHGDDCHPIAEVRKEFAVQLALQGTGKLKDGRILNVWGPCDCEHSPCFKETGTKWGTSGNGRPLQPYRTVAVDRTIIKLGSLLHIPQLEGRTMPGRAPWGGFVHDGCVIADDTGGGIKGHQLDLFVGRKSSVYSLSAKGGSHKWARNVAVYDGSKICERKGRRVGRRAASI